MSFKYLQLVFLIAGVFFNSKCLANQDEQELFLKYKPIRKAKSSQEQKSVHKGEMPLPRNNINHQLPLPRQKPSQEHQHHMPDDKSPKVVPQPPVEHQPQSPKVVPQPPVEHQPQSPKVAPQPPLEHQPQSPPGQKEPPLEHKPRAPAKKLPRSLKLPPKHVPAAPARKSQNHLRHTPSKDATRDGKKSPMMKLALRGKKSQMLHPKLPMPADGSPKPPIAHELLHGRKDRTSKEKPFVSGNKRLPLRYMPASVGGKFHSHFKHPALMYQTKYGQRPPMMKLPHPGKKLSLLRHKPAMTV